MTYQVIFSREANEDLDRLFVHVLERELNSPTGNLDIPERTIQAIHQACLLLVHSPFSCRKTGDNAFVREIIISFGGSGYVALFEIHDSQRVIIGAIRHQHENDYH